MFDLYKNLRKKAEASVGEMKNDVSPSKQRERAPFFFENDNYEFPVLYDEADSMLQVSLLIYTITDLRTLAKNHSKIQSPERILKLPLRFTTCLEMIEENIDVIKEAVGDGDHAMTTSALQSIQKRYDNHEKSTSDSHWWNSFTEHNGNVKIESMAPMLVAFGDDKPDSELVYAVGVDPMHKRVTVAFRGSVTTTDFLMDACIAINPQPNPVKDLDNKQKECIGIHHGFFEYLLQPGKGAKGGESKYEEILRHVTKLFERPDIRDGYKLYVTGHSLGGALSTLFSFHVAASALQASSSTETNHVSIPTPITCVSVASPRVGEGSFQSAFRFLEQRGVLRHLRIANDRDPVAIMPKISGKKMWAMLSPISYIAFKLADKQFEDKETYRHTGIKLKLRKPGSPYEIEYSGAYMTKEEGKSERGVGTGDALAFENIPDIGFHMGTAYCDNLSILQGEFKDNEMTLNKLYKEYAVTSMNDDLASCM